MNRCKSRLIKESAKCPKCIVVVLHEKATGAHGHKHVTRCDHGLSHGGDEARGSVVGALNQNERAVHSLDRIVLCSERGERYESYRGNIRPYLLFFILKV